MAKFTVTGDQHFGITGQMLEIQRQIRLKGGSPINPELIALALQDIIEGKFNKASKEEISVLHLLSRHNSITIDPCDGTKTLANDKEVFKAGIDHHLEEWGTNSCSGAIKETCIEIHGLVKDATFEKMFGSFGVSLNKLCLTQHQIIRFCEKYEALVRTSGIETKTFFLFKVGNQFFVAYARVLHKGLRIHVHRFEFSNPWEARYAPRIAVPQLTA